MLVKNILDQGIAARQSVADHHKIGTRGQLCCLVSAVNRNVLGFEQVAHRGVQRLVGAADKVARLTCDQRQATHEGATDADDVNLGAQPEGLPMIIMTATIIRD